MTGLAGGGRRSAGGQARGITAAGLLALASCVTAAPPPIRLTVMSWNIGDATGVEPAVHAVVEVLAALGWKDVYLLQEVLSSTRATELVDGIARAGGGPYHLAHSPVLGLAVLSREPLEPAETFVASASPLGRGALLVRTAARGRAVSVVDVHLDPIAKMRDASGRVDMGLARALGTVLREMVASTPRRDSVAEMLAWLERLAGSDASEPPGARVPLVVAGDFNTVPSSGAVRLMSERLVDASASSGHSLMGTYRRVRLPLRPRVDYVFVSSSITVLDARAVRRTAGDHYPVIATLELPPP